MAVKDHTPNQGEIEAALLANRLAAIKVKSLTEETLPKTECAYEFALSGLA